jgi:mannose-6-phosphate isomerase-like protein (cupin superfamily)
VAALNKHLSPLHKKNLAEVFDGMRAASAPQVAGQVNDMQIKLLALQGAGAWSFRQREDALFLVHRGRLQMKFRDRDEIVHEGEFIVVPHGVEYCPVALDERTCEILLIDPAGARQGRALSGATAAAARNGH